MHYQTVGRTNGKMSIRVGNSMGRHQQFIYLTKLARPEMLVDFGTAEEDAIVSQHFKYLQRLSDEGIVVISGQTLSFDPEAVGMVVFNAQDEKEAQAIMDADPAIFMGVMQAELYPFRLSLMTQH